MISKIQIIYEKVAKEHNLDLALVKSVGEGVLSYTKDCIMNADHGQLFISNFGEFIMKSTKVENQFKRYLQKRAYKKEHNPSFVNVPIPKKVKKITKMYLNTVIPYKKRRREIILKQLEYCKNIYENYTEEQLNQIPKYLRDKSLGK